VAGGEVETLADARTLPQRLADAFRSYWKPSLWSRDPALAAYFGYGPTASGVTVNETTALNFSAVWSAVTRISADVASLPLILYQRLPSGGKERMAEHPLYRVLHDAWNRDMSSFTARETMQSHVLTYGNAYAEIVRNGAGQIAELWPIEPTRVQPFRESPGGALQYRVQQGDGRTVDVPADVIFHVHGLGFDGIQGYSVIAKARESIGAGLAAQQFQNTFYANGVGFSGYFEHPKALSEVAHAKIKESINAGNQGRLRGGFRILEEGMTFKPGGMPLRDAEFLGTRKFDVTEIARWFNIPPHKLADLERATFSNIEEQSIDYVVGTLRGQWLVRWEQEILRKLIAPLERKLQFAEHLIDGLLRGNTGTRYQAYQVGLFSGFLWIDDVREKENLNPLPDGLGKRSMVQAAMIPLDRLDEVVDAQIRPAPTPAAASDDGESDRALTALVDDLKADVAKRLGVTTDEVVSALKGLQAAQAARSAETNTPIAGVTSDELHGALAALQGTLAATLSDSLSTDAALRAWQEATIASVTAGIVRRELKQLQRRAVDPAHDLERLRAFYRRLVQDGAAELHPWLARLRADLNGATETRAADLMREWSTEGLTEATQALTAGTVDDLIRRWAIERPPLLCRRVMEAVHG
jgi:HK97 family phage portal protein